MTEDVMKQTKRARYEGISTTNDNDQSDTTLNHLGKDILCHIISFLPLEEAGRASIISTMWRNLWTFVTVLNLSRENSKKTSMVLSSHVSNIKSCKICHSLVDVRDGRVLDWITKLKSKFVEHLSLINGKEMGIDYERLYFMKSRCRNAFDNLTSLPGLFGFHSLRALELHRYILQCGAPFEGCVKLDTLKLHRVKIISANETLAEIMSKCPQLTELSLIYCQDSKSKRFEMFDLRCDRLEFLEVQQLYYMNKICIHASRLHTLLLGSKDGGRKPCIRDVDINTPMLHTLKILDPFRSRFFIGCSTTYYEMGQGCTYRFGGFVNVKYLSVNLDLSSVRDTALLYWVFRSCRRLQKLHINSHSQVWMINLQPEETMFWRDEEVADRIPYKLKDVSINCFKATILELELVRYVLGYCANLETFLINCRTREQVDASMSLLLSPRASESVSLKITSDDAESY